MAKRLASRKHAGIQHTPRELDVIARADLFTAFIRLGPFDKVRLECGTHAAALLAAQHLADEHRRPALIYAVEPAGAAAYVGTVRPR